MVNKVDALLNFKDASGVLNEIYPITKKENVQGLAKYVDDKAPLIIDASTLTDSSSIINAFNLIYEAHEAGRIVFLKSNAVYAVLTVCTRVLAMFSHESHGTVTEALIFDEGTVQSIDINIEHFHNTITLTSANWDSATKTQTVNNDAVTITNIVTVSPATKASADIWAESGVFCTEQGDGTLKFTCTDIPTANISVNIVIEG